MNTSTINKILASNPITRKFYMGCFPADRIPRCRHFPCSMVVNLDESSKPGSHWIAIFAQSKHYVYYFDSFGLDAEGKIKEYLNKFDYVTRQIITVQSIISDVCGYYAIFFIYLCSFGWPYAKIKRRLDCAKNPDIFVRDFVRNYVYRAI